MKMVRAVLAAVVAAVVAVAIYAQVEEHPIPRLVQKDGRFALLVDGAPFLILGVEDQDLGLESTWPQHPKDWDAMEYLHANTIEIPIYWDQIEPQQGQFDFSSIDRLLGEARQHDVRLILLWFATWKNGSQHYMPDWMLTNPTVYFHELNRNGEAVDSPSPFAAASLDADERAFAAVMGHLKEADPQRTVIMVQVENEPGSWQSVRDFSPAAQKFFDAPVPPEILAAMHAKTASSSPNWQEAFGPDADEYFNAWSVARYIGQVAAAGKAVYPVPMDVNDALRDPFNPGLPGEPGTPGSYESGGPTDNVIPIWKAAAPSVDILAPDNYRGDPYAYVKDLELYHRDDNPLFLPESGCFQCDPASGDFGRFFFTALGLQPVGSSLSDTAPLPELARNFVLIGPMQREIAQLNFDGKLKAVAEPLFFKGGDHGKLTQTLPFGTWNAVVSYSSSRKGPDTGNTTPEGRALVAQLGDNQFLVAGYFCHVDFFPAGTEQQQMTQHIVQGGGQTPSALIDGKWQHRQFLLVEQGVYESGVFRVLRTQNGDATDYGLRFGEDPIVLRVTLGTY
jgi:uncharacterized protein DUF5597/glycosyl hydrolase family 42 (putative beta-galactosidase)